ncbi:MAG TPA: hypothetical protein VMT86_11555 [Bryobacteraceae bacterium]|nr:hypothetical protein [Bryobacteraceae bacterium]
MKILACMLLAGISLAADDPAKTTTKPPAKPVAAKRTAAAQTPAKPVVRPTIPPDAVETSPGLYRWTDKEGKTWMFRRSPFGVSRWPADAKDAEDAKASSAPQQTTAVAQGDSIRFERATPFGKKVWVRKKTELNETERQIWEQQQHKGATTAQKE